MIDAGSEHIRLGRLSKIDVMLASTEDLHLLESLRRRGRVQVYQRDNVPPDGIDYLVTTPVPCITSLR